MGQLRDETRLALTPLELADLQARHPILAQVLADIDRLETFAIGSSPLPQVMSDGPNPILTLGFPHPLTLAEAQTLLANARIPLADLHTDFFNQLRQAIFHHLQEVTP